MNQLTVIQTMSPQDIFTSGNLDTILGKISEEVKAHPVDISTNAGREEIKSLAYKIARSKTFLDDLGKKLGEEARVKLNAINAERKKACDHLDNLKEDFRKPLTEWENAEKNRVADHEKYLKNIVDIGIQVEMSWQTLTSEFINQQLGYLDSGNRNWEEFSIRAKNEIQITRIKLHEAIDRKTRHEAEQAELTRLRADAQERLKKDHEEKIAAAARHEAEQKAKAEAADAARKSEQDRLKIIQEKEESDRRAAQAIKDREEAEARAEREKLEAVEKEKQRAERERLAAIEAEKVREKNREHAAKINNAVLTALSCIGVDEDMGKKIITEIVSGRVPHTKITY